MKHNYKELKVWKKARDLNKEIYKISNSFPGTEAFGMTSQIRRASLSIISNIAEGSAYESKNQFSKFIKISIGSLCEVESLLITASDICYITDTQVTDALSKCNELKKMLISFKKTISNS